MRMIVSYQVPQIYCLFIMNVSQMFERNVQLYDCFIMQLNFIPDTFLEMVRMKQSDAKKGCCVLPFRVNNGLFSFCAQIASHHRGCVPFLRYSYFDSFP